MVDSTIKTKVPRIKEPKIKDIQEATKTSRWGYEQVLDYLANYIVKAALGLNMPPLGLTFFWVVGQFLTTFLFLLAEYKFFVWGIILFQFFFLVDLSDGKLYRFYSSEQAQHQQPGEPKPLFPKYLDRLGHFLNNALLFICLGIGVYWRSGQGWPLYAGLTAALLYLANKAITLNPAWYKSAEEQQCTADITQKAYPRSGANATRQFLFDVVRVEHLGNVLFFGILFDFPHYALLFYALLFLLEFLRKLWVQAKLLWREDHSQ